MIFLKSGIMGSDLVVVLWMLFAGFAIGPRPSQGLSNLVLSLPQAVLEGHKVDLRCDYNLDGASLYSIKWYRGDEEFYRYIPQEHPPAKVFALNGVTVDVDRSDEHLLALLTAQSGTYKCEVSAEAPLFQTAIKTGELTVVAAPQGSPMLRVDRVHLPSPGHIVANCTAPPSRPAANISWLLDGRSYVGPAAIRTELSAEGESLWSQIQPHVGAGERLSIQCVAKILDVWISNSNLVHVYAAPPQAASVSRAKGAGSTMFRSQNTSFVVLSALLAIAGLSR